MVLYITSLAQMQGLIESGKPLIIDFTAEWCGPCRGIAPTFESYATQYSYSINFVKVDVDQAPAVAEFFGVKSMPTFIAFRNNAKIMQFSGANAVALKNMVQQLI